MWERNAHQQTLSFEEKQLLFTGSSESLKRFERPHLQVSPSILHSFPKAVPTGQGFLQSLREYWIQSLTVCQRQYLAGIQEVGCVNRPLDDQRSLEQIQPYDFTHLWTDHNCAAHQCVDSKQRLTSIPYRIQYRDFS